MGQSCDFLYDVYMTSQGSKISYPLTLTMATVDLWMIIGGKKKQALRIPIDKCYQLAVHPLKWVHYLGYAIFGRRGYLSLSRTGPPITNYTGDIEAQAYYFRSDGKLEFHGVIFAHVVLEEPRLVDDQAINDRMSDTSDVTERTANFRLGIVDRDETCRGTSEQAMHCTACHIIPHSKGDNVRC